MAKIDLLTQIIHFAFNHNKSARPKIFLCSLFLLSFFSCAMFNLSLKKTAHTKNAVDQPIEAQIQNELR